MSVNAARGRSFRSDNNAGLCPEALEAFIDASAGHAVGYADDEWTASAVQAFRAIFSPDAAVFFVATGTIANTLSIAALTDPWQRVLCHAESHWNDDESTAPELFTRCRTAPIHAPSSKLTPDDIVDAASSSRGDVHQPQPGALTISNPTEYGEVYTPEETRALADVAHQLGYRLHVDGARFANAVARLSVQPADLAGRAGVDALCFGGTKNGLAFGEAVILFPQDDPDRFQRAVARFPFLRKSAGALLSKHRFVSAPFLRTIESGAWLAHAQRANDMADRLVEGLDLLGLEIAYPVQANAVFVVLSRGLERALHAAGHAFYPFGEPARRVFRLMCSFDTTEDDVDAFLADVQAAIGSAP